SARVQRGRVRGRVSPEGRAVIFLPGPEQGAACKPGAGINIACNVCDVAWETNGGGYNCWQCGERGKSVAGLAVWLGRKIKHPNIVYLSCPGSRGSSPAPTEPVVGHAAGSP